VCYVFLFQACECTTQCGVLRFQGALVFIIKKYVIQEINNTFCKYDDVKALDVSVLYIYIYIYTHTHTHTHIYGSVDVK